MFCATLNRALSSETQTKASTQRDATLTSRCCRRVLPALTVPRVEDEAGARPQPGRGGSVDEGPVVVRVQDVDRPALRAASRKARRAASRRPRRALDRPAEVFDVPAQGPLAAQAGEGEVEAIPVGVAGELDQQLFLPAHVQPLRQVQHAQAARSRHRHFPTWKVRQKASAAIKADAGAGERPERPPKSRRRFGSVATGSDSAAVATRK
ncbi:MAG: hypothetical protein U0793_02860 [Gemmataceae bacterium]